MPRLPGPLQSTRDRRPATAEPPSFRVGPLDFPTPQVVKYSLLPPVVTSREALAVEQRRAGRLRAERAEQQQWTRKAPLPLAARLSLPGLHLEPLREELEHARTVLGHPRARRSLSQLTLRLGFV